MRGLSAVGIFLSSLCAAVASTNGSPEVVFSRIIHGWTNYSTSFSVTHDTGVSGEFASVGSFYTPTADTVALDYAAIVIWEGTAAPNFANFQFKVFVWSSLDAFTQDPRQGDLRTWSFVRPTGGSTSVPDTRTRPPGNRPAYELRFSLTNNLLTLSNGHTYVMGFAARTDIQSNDRLFVPTAPTDGLSDVQAGDGDVVVGGWRYIVNAGGKTVYSGQLAVELVGASQVTRPRLTIARSGRFLHITWPVTGHDFALEYAFTFSSNADWFPVQEEPYEEDGMMHVILPVSFTHQWFRLRG